MGGRDTQRPRRGARTLLRCALTLALIAGLVGLDSAVTAATSPERRTDVIEVSSGLADAPTHDDGFATVFLNGLGLDISAEQARALTPAVGRFGRVYALEYASVFDADEAADALHAALRAQRAASPPVHLTVVASSMGDVRGLEIIASLGQRHPDVVTVGFVVNTGPGPGKRTRVKGGRAVQALLDQSCSPFVPGQVTLGLLELVNQGHQGHVRTFGGAVRAFNAGTTYSGPVVVNQLCSLTRPSALARPPYVPFTAYLTTGSPEDDVIVDGDGAYEDWRTVLPGMQLRRVDGATHDNFSHRPDLFNPLFADDLMPLIRAQQIARTRVAAGHVAGARRPV